MKRHAYKHKNDSRQIVAVTLAFIGFIIFVNVMPMRFLLFFIGIALLLMGVLLFIK